MSFYVLSQDICNQVLQKVSMQGSDLVIEILKGITVSG